VPRGRADFLREARYCRDRQRVGCNPAFEHHSPATPKGGCGRKP